MLHILHTFRLHAHASSLLWLEDLVIMWKMSDNTMITRGARRKKEARALNHHHSNRSRLIITNIKKNE